MKKRYDPSKYVEYPSPLEVMEYLNKTASEKTNKKIQEFIALVGKRAHDYIELWEERLQDAHGDIQKALRDNNIN